MRHREKSPERKALQESWGRWVKIVDLFARRRVARRRVDPQVFVALHRELIKNCRALAASANDVDAVFYRYLEELVQPWLNVDTLVHADRDILFDLLLRCQQVEEELQGRSSMRSILSSAAPFFVSGMCFAAVLLCIRTMSFSYATLLYRARGWTDEFWFDVAHVSGLEWLGFVGCALIGVSVYLVSRPAHR